MKVTLTVVFLNGDRETAVGGELNTNEGMIILDQGPAERGYNIRALRNWFTVIEA